MSELRTYRWPVSTWWWVRKRTYFLFVMRELSSIFVAWWVVYLLAFIAAVGRGDDDYNDFLDFAANPLVVIINVVAFAFVVLHAVTWFALTPKAMDVRLGGRPVPTPMVVGSQYAALIVVSLFILWLVS